MSDDNQTPEEDDDLPIEEAPSEPLPSQEEILEGLPEIPQDVSLDEQMAAQARRPSRFKKEDIEKIVKYAVIGGVLLLVLLIVYSCQPKKGPIPYGICANFLELNTDYPHTIHITDVEFSNTAVRIYFTNIDPFGEFKLEMAECTFAPDRETGMRLSEVKRNRIPVDTKVVSNYNKTLRFIDT